jgi:mannose-6-phosphate isomerase-like protein (cupin superfamily)
MPASQMEISMGKVFSIDDISWSDLRGLPGARGFEFKALTDDNYTKAYSCELVRLEPGDHSVPHIEPWSHLLYFLSGTGDITIDGDISPVRSSTVCQVNAGEKHSLRNLGSDDMLILTIYDPPRRRNRD